MDTQTTEPTRKAVELVTVFEAAEQLRLHPDTLRKMTSRGRIECVRIGRKVLFTPDQMQTFIDGSRRRNDHDDPEAEAEDAAARAALIDRMQRETAERADNPWGRARRGKRRTAA
ncbi:MAG: helix-turn-helix domain-containing protein [Actinobacteria bacterium]|nr:helix-turn-helix domain-containing protein [Actinomycetota bacterium]MBU1609686.1 helix-turn-helix domain-containing protein [Actinomycetota bacterium]MBU2316191.1 helix-turn-helix domain-containing protein [Actinomycetota bacterium]MBU2385667.1 helix-turn-helix domain-containing protein [Actinomycetota bacterium]